MKTIIIFCSLFLIVSHPSCTGNTHSEPLAMMPNHQPSPIVMHKTDANTKNIQVALLLDTSNSMDGLIDQAKAQLWKIVNELSYAECGQAVIRLQIALYEYGNDNLSAQEGHIRQVLPFSEDLDEISEKLFGLRTNGGNEFCGKVITTSINQLAWKKDDSHLKIICIAGNESFTQGPVHYRDATTDALEKGITINTIFCGNYSQGISARWKDSADRTHGVYSAIDHNIATKHNHTPYDDEILQLNKKLNDTYIHYGAKGQAKKQMQSKQDAHAYAYSAGNAVTRTISKSSKFYKNKSWDLVDALAEKEVALKDLKDQELPEALQNQTPEAIKAHIAEKKKARNAVQKEIQALQRKRSTYLAQQSSTNDQTLEKALVKAIKEQGKQKSFEWKNEK